MLREARSLPRLLDLTAALLHRPLNQMRTEKRLALEELHELDRPLANRKALIVDDDMRNIFALATVLEEHGMLHARAENGRDAINLIQTDPSIDIVLMDIMMPEMDGMQTMQEIRKLPAGRDLPMIAVTAKAMKGDREKCIEAGAWDYLSKPVNTTDLLTVLRAWLHR
jgi:CheY-like chemotaxis protein